MRYIIRSGLNGGGPVILMSKSSCQILVAIVAIALSGIAAARDITREGALALTEECQVQREENIAPLRAQAIEDCVTIRRRDREYCERFNRTFGNPRPNANGGMTRGLFWELPVCQQASAAERFFRINPSRQVYSSP
jgi:hypothetical protein